jgi:hypothetical protein
MNFQQTNIVSASVAKAHFSELLDKVASQDESLGKAAKKLGVKLLGK